MNPITQSIESFYRVTFKLGIADFDGFTNATDAAFLAEAAGMVHCAMMELGRWELLHHLPGDRSIS